jgi:hypothetical protein
MVGIPGAGTPTPRIDMPCVPATLSCPSWEHLHDGKAAQGDWAMSSAMDRAGRTLFTVGYSYGPGSTTALGSVLATKTSTGEELWSVERAGGGDLSVSVLSSVQASADGSQVFVVGSAFSATRCQVIVASYSGVTGALRWDSSLPVGPAPSEYYAHSTLTPDGKRLVNTSNSPATSTFQGQKVNRDVTAAFDSKNGRRQWLATSSPAGYGVKNWRVTSSPDSKSVYVVSDRLGASSATTATPVGWRVTRYSVATGKRDWATDYSCTRNYGNSTAQGVIYGASTPSPYCADPGAIAASTDRVFITGSNGLGYATAQVAAFSAKSGKLLWKVDRDPLASYVYLNRSLVVTGDGTALYAGHNRIDPNAVNPPQFVIERMDPATGAIRWTQTVPANSNASAYCGGCGPLLGLDTRGSVYLAGSYPLGDPVVTTAVLDGKTGAVSHSGLYFWSPASLYLEIAQSLSVSADGRVFTVSGAAVNPSANCAQVGCYDMASLAYVQ